MGMAASQARLLTLTARIHDVEYEAQALQNAKVQLSTQSDQVYQEYLDALDATSLTISTDSNTKVTATFNNLCSLNKVSSKTYALFDNRGRLIVDDDVYEKFTSFSPKSGDQNNAISFAMYAMGIEVDKTESSSLATTEESVYNEIAKTADEDSLLVKYYNNALDTLNDLNKKYGNTVSAAGIFDNNTIEDNDDVSKEDKQLYENALLTFRNQLYKQAGGDIYSQAEENEYGKSGDFDYSTFQYYVSIFNQIKQAGGCVPISEFNNGDSNSNAANSSEWLKSKIESGEITMAQVTMDTTSTKVSFGATSPSTDETISYTQTTEIDKTALAKAEAEYEHDMSAINKKDERYDLELSKLESERTALTTEYDSVKKVIEDNIDRTFGIFS